MGTANAYLREYSRDAVNIELKGSIKKKHIPSLLELVAPHRNDRSILFVSLRQGVLTTIHELEQKNPYPTGLSVIGNLAFGSGVIGKNLHGRAVQTSYTLACPRFIQRAKDKHAAFHVFFTNFNPFPAIDSQPGTPSQMEIDKYLQRGVDGIITDRPRRLRHLIDDWARRNA